MERLPADELLRLAGIMAQDVISEAAAADSAVDLLMHDETVPLEVRGKLSLVAEQVRAAAGPAKWFILMAHTQQELKAKETDVVDVGEYLSDLSQLFRRLLPESIDFKMELGTGLWPARLSRNFDDALFTFIVKARDCMPNGGTILYRATNVDEATCRSMTGLFLDGDRVLIEISDNGVGIPPAQLERVFDPFVPTNGPVNGFGLAKAYRTVSNINGHIRVTSEVGKGTTFKVFVPRYIGCMARQMA